MGIVAFNYDAWVARYPELAGSVSPQLAAAYFAEAELYCDNTPGSIVTDESRRSLFLNMLVSHIAQLNAPLNGQPSQTLVGRISSASQGSVTVSIANDYPPGTVQWFQATKYGAAYWVATSPYRTAKYVPAPVRNMDPFRPIRSW